MLSDSHPSFPLLDRPWILALDRGGRNRTVSLRQLFAECDELLAVTGDVPTQTMAIIRLLLAVLHCSAGGPPDERAWRSLWRSPGLPLADIESYLGDFRERFDLLHPTTPFYQVADLRTATGEISGLERLIADVPNNEPYLTSRVGPGLRSLTPAEAARWLVHCQAFDTSGIKSGAVGDSRVKGGKGYPIGPGLCGSLGGIFLEGRTVRETLLLNLIPFDFEYLAQETDDSPAWERAPHGAAEEPETARGPFGRLSLYTWQSRRIRLFGDENTITGVLIANGDKLDWEDRHRHEPMTAWRRSANKEKERKRSPVYMPAQHDHTRAMWRGLHALLPATGSSHEAEGPARISPPLAQWLARVRNAGYLESDFRVTTHAVGAVYGTQWAVIDEIFQDQLTMNVQAFDASSGLPTLIIDAADDADAAVKTLRTLAANVCRAAGGSGNDRKDPPASAAKRAAELAFAELDRRFRDWLYRLGPDTAHDIARTEWQWTVRRVVLDVGADLVAQAGPSAWVGRRIDKTYLSTSQAEVWFRRALSKTLRLATTEADPDHDRPHDPQEVAA